MPFYLVPISSADKTVSTHVRGSETEGKCSNSASVVKRWATSSEEVVRRATGHVWLSASRCRVELQERVLQLVVQLNHRRLVAAAVAVVRSREHRHNVAVVAPVVPLKDIINSIGVVL